MCLWLHWLRWFTDHGPAKANEVIRTSRGVGDQNLNELKQGSEFCETVMAQAWLLVVKKPIASLQPSQAILLLWLQPLESFDWPMTGIFFQSLAERNLEIEFSQQPGLFIFAKKMEKESIWNAESCLHNSFIPLSLSFSLSLSLSLSHKHTHTHT